VFRDVGIVRGSFYFLFGLFLLPEFGSGDVLLGWEVKDVLLFLHVIISERLFVATGSRSGLVFVPVEDFFEKSESSSSDHGLTARGLYWFRSSPTIVSSRWYKCLPQKR